MSNMKNPLSRALFGALALLSLGLAALPAAAATTPAQVTDQAGVSAADIDRLVSTLQDDQKRQQLIKQLQTLSAAEKGNEPAAPPTPSDFLSVVTDHLQSIGSDMVDATTVLVAALGAPLTSLALLFGPAEYFSLMVLGLVFAVVLAKGSVLKAIAMIIMGLLMSMVGSDIETGASRMAFDVTELSDGIGFVLVAMGV